MTMMVVMGICVCRQLLSSLCSTKWQLTEWAPKSYSFINKILEISIGFIELSHLCIAELVRPETCLEIWT